MDFSNLTNEQIMELVRERGLAQPQPEQQQPAVIQSLTEKITHGNHKLAEEIRTASSVRTMPLASKTKLLDYCISELLKLNRYSFSILL